MKFSFFRIYSLLLLIVVLIISLISISSFQRTVLAELTNLSQKRSYFERKVISQQIRKSLIVGDYTSTKIIIQESLSQSQIKMISLQQEGKTKICYDKNNSCEKEQWSGQSILQEKIFFDSQKKISLGVLFFEFDDLENIKIIKAFSYYFFWIVFLILIAVSFF